MKTLVILAALTALAAPAAAQPMDARSISVRTSDLDLSKSADAGRMVSRIRIAAMQACRRADPPELSAALDNRRCRDQAVDTAVRLLNAPLVTARVQGAGPGPVLAAK